MFTIVTLKEIAASCGVSVSTVSRAFDKNSSISLPVRQQILTCAAEMGYTPNLLARSLKNDRSMTIAFIVPSINNHFYIDLLQHLEIALHQYGYRVLVTFVQKGVSTELDCLEMAAASHVDGIIFFPKTVENQQYISSLTKRIHFIQGIKTYECIDSVTINNISGTRVAIEYLMDQGHKKILYVGGEERIEGCWQAFDAAQIPRDNLLALPRTITVDALCQEIMQFRPTAIFPISHRSETAWRAIRQLGLSIPEDISFITYDDAKWIKMMEITVITHDLETFASTLVQQLLQRLKGDKTSIPQHIVLDSFIIERKSVQKR